MTKSKIIILSDVHMSNDAYYSWFKRTSENNYVQCITDMLEMVAADQEVTELLLLGDFFDLWLYPADMVPWTAQEVMTHWDSTVFNALRKCVAKLPKVFYQNGNHDMTVTAEEVGTIEAGGKQVQWISVEEYSKKYEPLLHAEHGNAIDMFNAPDHSPGAVNSKPLGYYMARILASKPDKSGGVSAWGQMTEVIEKACASYTPESGLEDGSKMVSKLIDLLVEEVQSVGGKMNDQTVFRFADSGQDVTIGTVKKGYQDILNRWYRKDDKEWLPNCAMAMFKPQRAGLNWYAERLIDSSKAKVVVMGHVHHDEWEDYSEKSASGTYVNDGCWCAATPDHTPYYVEIEIQPEEEIAVSLMKWDSATQKGILVKSSSSSS